MGICNPLTCVYPCCYGQLRYVIIAVGVFSIIVTHCQRTVLNIGIVEMVGKSNAPSPTCRLAPGTESSVIRNITGGKVDWDEVEQNLNLASFYIGYVVLQIPSGILCDIYGARHFVIWGTFVSSITTVAIPPIIIVMQWPWWVVFILRILTGFGQSVLYPGLSSLIGRWIPAYERATVGAVVFASNSIGLIVGNLGTGTMIKHTKDWAIPFYVWTAAGLLFVVIALVYIFSDPKTHPFLTDIEKDYLNEMVVSHQLMNKPFWKMMKDKCVIGLLFGQLSHDLVMFTLTNNLPKYMNNVMGFDIETNGLISLIYLFQWFSSFAFGKLADFMVSRNVNITLVRKIYTILSVIVAGICMLSAGMAKCNRVLVVSLFAMATFWNGLYYCGMKVHIIDISVNHTGMVMSIVNGLGATSGFVCSYLAGAVARDNDHDQWTYFFLILLGCHVVAMILYAYLTTCDRRPWDYLPGEEPVVKKKASKWYLELSNSEHELRIQKEFNAKEARNERAKAAKAKMKANLEARNTPREAEAT